MSEVSESFETGYYKAVVDDMSVSIERIREERDEARLYAQKFAAQIEELQKKNSVLEAEKQRLMLAMSQGTEL